MAEAVPVFIVPPPVSKRKPWWAGIVGYIRYLGLGLAILAALKLASVVLGWF